MMEETKDNKDPRPTSEIIAAILAEEDEDRQWEMIISLQYRGTREVFDAAADLTRSVNPDERVLGVDILAQLGEHERPFKQQTADLLLSLLSTETDERTTASIASAFGHLRDERAIPALLELAEHPSVDVRYSVACALGSFCDVESVQAVLLTLTCDADADVRDWATFWIGEAGETDTPEIRDALAARMQDESASVRGEAMRGLAKLGDERVVEPLMKELREIASAEEHWDYAFEAVGYMPDARFHDLLVTIRERGVLARSLQQAIAACRIPSPDEYQEPDDQPTTCPVCGLREVFSDSDEWQFCQRCGWSFDEHQRADPDLERGCNRWSLRQERERWQKRLEAGGSHGMTYWRMACEVEVPPEGAGTTCPVCDLEEAFSEPSVYDICERCGWEDDPVQFANPDFSGGANRGSLRQERERWRKRLSLPGNHTDAPSV